MSNPMQKIMKFFLVMAETEKNVEEVRQLADQLFHDECRMQCINNSNNDGKKKCLNKTRILADMEELANNNVTMELTRIEQDECGLSYDYIVRKPREHCHKMTASAMVRDGKIYHVDLSDDTTTATTATETGTDPRMRRVSAPIIRGF